MYDRWRTRQPCRLACHAFSPRVCITAYFCRSRRHPSTPRQIHRLSPPISHFAPKRQKLRLSRCNILCCMTTVARNVQAQARGSRTCLRSCPRPLRPPGRANPMKELPTLAAALRRHQESLCSSGKAACPNRHRRSLQMQYQKRCHVTAAASAT